METVVKKLENCMTEVKVTYDKEEWKKAQDRALNRLASRVNLDGFRKGKAPKNLVKARIGKANLFEEAANLLLQDSYAEVFVKNEIPVVGQPTANIDKMSDDELEVTFTAPVAPEITLGQYKGLEVKKDEVTVTDEDIEESLKNYQNQFAELVIKDEGAVEEGDTVVINYKGLKDGVAFDGGTADNYSLEIGSHTFIPGFEEALIGMTTGEEKDIDLTFPEEYHAEELAGAAVVFQVKVNEIKYKELPAIDDDLALDVNIDGVETLDQLKEHIKSQLTSQREATANNKFEDELFKALLANTPFDVPEVMVEEQMQDMVSEINRNLQQQGLNMDQYLKFTGKTMDDVKSDLRDQAEERVKIQLILAEIVKAENITVTEDDVDAEYQDIAAMYQMDIEKVKELLGAQEAAIRSDIATRRAVNLIKDNVK